MSKQLEYVLAYNFGLVEAVRRDYVTKNLFKRITMDAYVKQVLTFTVTQQGLLNYIPPFGESSFDVQRGITRVVNDVIKGVPGFTYMELGYTNEMIDMLYFHVYGVEFKEVTQWQ